METLGIFNLQNRAELLAKEQEFIDNLNPPLNDKSATPRTAAQKKKYQEDYYARHKPRQLVQNPLVPRN